MSENNQKQKKTNVFLNNKPNHNPNEKNNIYKNDYKNDKNNDSLRNNRFVKQTGKNTMREFQEKRDGFNANNTELFPSLLNELNLLTISKKNRKKQDIISYKDIANNTEKSYKKIESDEVDPGWVHFYRDEDNTIIRLDGRPTETWLELERKEIKNKKEKEKDELNHFLKELEDEQILRKELYGDIYKFYDPNKDKYYIKEKDIILYTSNETFDSDTEGSNDNNEDGPTYDNYL
jgi:hypothetical protein